MSNNCESATAFAPASIGNVAVGYDMLGLAIAGVGDSVTAMRAAHGEVRITAIETTPLAQSASSLSLDTRQNCAGIAAAALWRDFGPGFGLDLRILKGIPLGSGMGSSAASAVAGAVAANALLPQPLPFSSLMPYALEGERFASEALHADNVAPSLLGGLVLCPARLLPDVISLPVPAGIQSVVVHPDLIVNTADSRRVLAPECLLRTAIEQQGCMAAFVAACYGNRPDIIRKCLRDIVIEPQRAPLVQGFHEAKAAALDAGALGCSLSGSGPSVFAWADEARASDVRDAIVSAFAASGLAADAWISSLDSPGATVTAE